MRILFKIILAALAAAGPACAAEPDGWRTVLFTDFSKDFRAWGAVSRAGEALLLDRGEVLVPVTELRDAIVEYRARVQGEGILNLRFRYDLDKNLFYMFRIDTRPRGGNPPGFLKRNPTDKWWHLCGKRLAKQPSKPGQWVTVKVVIQGSRFEGYVDRRRVAELEDGDYPAGFLAFLNELCPAEIAWVRVSVPESSRARILGIPPGETESGEQNAMADQRRWRAEWIWLNGPKERLVRFFRRTFDLPAEAGEALLAVTCDNEYEVWINGRRIGSDGTWQNVEVYDVTRVLHKGRNVIAVRGENEAPGAAGVLAELGVNCLDGTYINVHTDQSWKAALAAGPDWMQPDFDDRGWSPARSLGRHPQPPWANQARLVPPDLGPKRPLRLVRLRAPRTVTVNEPFEIEALMEPLQPLAPGGTLEVVLHIPGDVPYPLTSVKPAVPTDKWPVRRPHSERLRVRIRPDAGYLFADTSCRLLVRTTGTYLAPGSVDGAPVRLETGKGLRFVGFREAKPAKSGVLRDAAGRRHPWRLRDDGAILIDGIPYAVLPGSGGVYFCRLDAAALESLQPLDWAATGRRLCAEGGPLPEDVVRVRLVDHVDCRREDHEFSEDGGLGGHSRVVRIGDRRYRVTAARRRLSYFAYTMQCTAPRNPHLLLFQTVNDRERYTTVRIQPPWDNVGGGVYTGREYPCDGRPIECAFLFYPREQRIRLTVSSRACYEGQSDQSGAAVSHLWLFELEDVLADRPVTVLSPQGRERRLGMYLTNPPYCYRLYGFHDAGQATRSASMRSFRDYLKFCGVNLFEFNAVDGADTTSSAHYPSRIWPARDDVLGDALRFLAPAGIDIVPIITSLNVAEGKFGFTRESFQIDRFGKRTHFFGSRPPLPDPLRPEAQKIMLDTLREILDICGKNPAVPAVGFRANGKIGLCYGGAQLGASDRYTGYSEWDVAEFRKDTGIDVPRGLKPTAYEWIRTHCWEQWLAWRCKRTAQFWRRMRDVVRSCRSDLLLMASCDMPSETPSWNIYWPEGESPLRCMIYHGVDPRLFSNEPNLLLQRGMMISADRYFTGHGQYDRNHWALKAFHYAPGVVEMYAGRYGGWCELYHNYWEEFGVFPQGEFRTHFWGAATMAPFGGWFYEPIAFSLYAANAYAVNLFSWERGTFAHEHDLRAFARAFRALPCMPGEDGARFVVLASPRKVTAGGMCALKKPQRPTEPEGAGLWTRWFGDRLAVCNFSPEPVAVRVTWPRPLPEGRRLVEVAAMQRLIDGPEERPSIVLRMAPYRLRTVVEMQEEAAR